jgi:response regulator RpfG family c-di-GMP phosphodiesterase
MTEAQIANILIVGSKDGLCRDVHRTLANQPYRYTCATSAQEAVSLTRGERVDAAVLDLASIGAPTGLHLAASLRREASDLPIVVLTAASSVALAVEALRLGATDCLRAPISPEQLREAVRRAVRWGREALRGRGRCERLAREMSARSTALVRACAESGIGSGLALEQWVAALYGRDPWTWHHVSRVSKLSVTLATMLGRSHREATEIGRAALLHDVGRLSIPSAVTGKPEPLTAEERTLVRTHVQISYEMAMALPYLEPLAVTLFTVRERHDGTGYPLGLVGDAIPFGARVIAVAEAFDSLAAGVDDPVVTDQANAAVVQGAGALFDPAVVHAWLRCADHAVRELSCY